MLPLEFGRLETGVDGVDFGLPPSAPENVRVLATATPRGTPRVRVGLAGWSDRGFVGRLHPPGTRPEEFLRRYARAFGAVELNTTYYGVSEERVARWTAAAGEDFRFCPKLPSAVTHDAELVGADAAMERFLQALEGFGGRAGRAWGVLPPGFGPERLGVLDRFLSAWAHRLPLAVEVRHPAWFARRRAREELFACLEHHGVVAVITDVAGRRDVCHQRLTTDECFLRIVGNQPHPSDEPRLAAWVDRLAEWFGAGLGTAWVFLHQRSDPRAVSTARRFAALARARLGVDPLPDLPDAESVAVPRQTELF